MTDEMREKIRAILFSVNCEASCGEDCWINEISLSKAETDLVGLLDVQNQDLKVEIGRLKRHIERFVEQYKRLEEKIEGLEKQVESTKGFNKRAIAFQDDLRVEIDQLQDELRLYKLPGDTLIKEVKKQKEKIVELEGLIVLSKMETKNQMMKNQTNQCIVATVKLFIEESEAKDGWIFGRYYFAALRKLGVQVKEE